MSQNLRSNRWLALQTQPLRDWHSHKMHHHCPGQGAPPRDTYWDLRTPRCAMLLGRKGIPTGILLANSHAQCGRHRPCMQRMPVLRRTNPPTSPSPSGHSHNMVVRRMGLRHGRATQKGTRRVHPLTCRNRQVHQMDRGKTNHYD